MHKQEPNEPEIVVVKPERVPYPKEIKVRHPLHGIHFSDKTNLPEKVTKSLIRAVAASNAAQNSVVIKNEADDDVDMKVAIDEAVPVKRAKKRKAPKEEQPMSDDDVDDASEVAVKEEDAPRKAKRAKKVKVEENGDVNLDWLAAI